jgi:hypothetical protein
MSVTPSLPRKGEAPQGEYPFDPRYSSLLFGFFTNSLKIYHNLGRLCGGGRESRYPGFQRVPEIKKQ